MKKAQAVRCPWKLVGSWVAIIIATCQSQLQAQERTAGITSPRPISPELFGIFFEDISYAADGGLYAERVQNRSFEYTLSDHDTWSQDRAWGPFAVWRYIAEGYGYGSVEIATHEPVHPNNPHYVVLSVEHVGEGVGLANTGFDGIALQAGEAYNFSIFVRTLAGTALPFQVALQDPEGKVVAEGTFTATSKDWKKYTLSLTAANRCDHARLVVKCKAAGVAALDMISLFPAHTFHDHPNGLRADLAQVIADLQPKFMRFPGGCLVHGDGLGNMYRWKETIGPVETRVEQRNIWNYHQTVGLGYFEYFQFCEDMGAAPVPILPAAVSCQNSGGSWRAGGIGQQTIPLDQMDDYIQDVLDLIEYANGPATSTWGAKRAAAGHPQPFHLKYLGVGNEDKITPAFNERFTMIYEAVKAKHPEITIIGTVGPFPDGEDYDKGWEIADALHVPMVDEHYYKAPNWFLENLTRYDNFDRSASKIYLGEYAAHDENRKNTFRSALVEAAYMTNLEYNGDVVRMSSYAPLLAKQGHTSWNPDLIYYTNTEILRTANYYVQQMFSNHAGTMFYPNVVTLVKGGTKEAPIAYSCVKDDHQQVFVKLVNPGSTAATVAIDLSAWKGKHNEVKKTLLQGQLDDYNTFEDPNKVHPETATISLRTKSTYEVPPYSVTVLQIPVK